MENNLRKSVSKYILCHKGHVVAKCIILQLSVGVVQQLKEVANHLNMNHFV